VLVGADVGSTIRVAVTAANGGGSATAVSAATAVVQPAAPVNSTPPTISGSAQQGASLSSDTGVWSNGPTGYGYQWRRCDGSGSGCADIAGATGSSYVLVGADVGSTIRVAVTAANGGGSATAVSAATAVVQPAPVTGTFGLTTVGTRSDQMLPDRKRVDHFQLTVAASVSKLTMYLAPTGTSGQQVMKGVVYADQAGSPGALVAVSNPLTFHTIDGAGWYDLVFPAPVSLQAGTYWIGVISGGTANVAGFRWNSVAGARAYNVNSYSSGPTNPFGTPTIDSEQMSIYATYSSS
jgi:hypothetical protein